MFAGAFVVLNWGRIPGGLAGFLASRITIKNLIISLICLFGGGIAFYCLGLKKSSRPESIVKELAKVTTACVVGAGLALLFPLTSSTNYFDRRTEVYFLPVAIVACMAGRVVARACSEHIAGFVSGRRSVIIVGSGLRALNLYKQIGQSKEHRFEVLGFVEVVHENEADDEVRSRIIGSLEQLESILMRQAVDEVLISLPGEPCHAQIQDVLRTCERTGVDAKCLVSDIFEFSLAKPRMEPMGHSSVISMNAVDNDARILVKRGIDIVFSVLGLIVLAPLMLGVALAIRLTSHGSPVFVQERYGFRKRRFRMYKFRTMVANAEALQSSLEGLNEACGPAFKIRNDPRVTPLGRILRKTSFDELPQLINVLKGEMSLVGPRPLPIRDVSRFDNASLMRRFSVKPGLTCLWQISGRSETDFDRWVALDLKYIDEWSLGLDLEILFKTVPTIVKTRGAF